MHILHQVSPIIYRCAKMRTPSARFSACTTAADVAVTKWGPAWPSQLLQQVVNNRIVTLLCPTLW